MIIPFLDLASQYKPLEEKFREAFSEVLQSHSFVLGPFLEKFESDLAHYLDVPFVVGLNSGTDALCLALKALGVGLGDEVITVPNTFYATVEAILQTGAKPVFVDVDPQTALMEVNQIPDKITPRTKVILPVHLYGQPASMEDILKLAAQYHLAVVEDACQAIGSVYRGQKIGTIGDVGAFSFYPGKNLGALGDGGALVTKRPEIAEKARKLRNHGGLFRYQHDLVGTNSRLDALQAKILSVTLPFLDSWNQFRRKAALRYVEGLADLKGIRPLHRLGDRTSNEHLFVIQVPPEKRDRIRARLSEKGIETGIHYPMPIHQILKTQGLMDGSESFPVVEGLSRSILSLPIYPGISPTQMDAVAAALAQEVC